MAAAALMAIHNGHKGFLELAFMRAANFCHSELASGAAWLSLNKASVTICPKSACSSIPISFISISDIISYTLLYMFLL